MATPQAARNKNAGVTASYQVVRAGNQGKTERAGDLADAVGGLRQADTPRAQSHRKNFRRVGRDVGEAPVFLYKITLKREWTFADVFRFPRSRRNCPSF
jgi:hypothetical protein